MDDIANLNISCTLISIKRSTLRFHEDTVLARQFDNTVWTQHPVKEWNQEQVIQWAKKYEGISDKVADILENNEINVMELLALGREDFKEMDINRTVTLALVTKAIRDLQRETQGNVTFIEQ
eukprot:13896718-Ditylum_brightwellii.AAC.1